MYRKAFSRLMFLAVLGSVACNEDPLTGPPPFIGGTSGGSTNPQTAVVIALTGPTGNVPVGTPALLSASITQNNAPVADGTLVQFTTTLGTFSDGNLTTTSQRTANGFVVATLRTTTPGTATVAATVNTTVRSVPVTFVAATTTTP